MKKIINIFLVVVLLVFSINTIPVSAFSTKPTVKDEQMLIFSYLAYINFNNNQIGKTISSIKTDSNITSSKKFRELKQELGTNDKVYNLLKKVDNWVLIKHINDNDGWTGFGVAVFENKKSNDVVIAYRGTEKNLGDIVEDSTMANSIENLNVSTNQRRFAELIAANAFINRPNSNIYFTGHSLGGFLAQYVTFESKEKILHKYLELPTVPAITIDQKARLKEQKKLINDYKIRLSKLSYDKKVAGLVTFNAPGVFKKETSWKKYSVKYQLAKNYVISGDPVGELFFSLGKGSYGKTYLKRYESKIKLFDSHGIINFFKYSRIIK